MRAEHIGLAVQRFNHSATSSSWRRLSPPCQSTTLKSHRVQGTFGHPTRRQFFANTVGRICKLNLALRHWEVVIDPETNPCLIGSSDLVYKGHWHFPLNPTSSLTITDKERRFMFFFIFLVFSYITPHPVQVSPFILLVFSNSDFSMTRINVESFQIEMRISSSGKC